MPNTHRRRDETVLSRRRRRSDVYWVLVTGRSLVRVSVLFFLLLLFVNQERVSVDEVQDWVTKFEPVLQSYNLSYIGTLCNDYYFHNDFVFR